MILKRHHSIAASALLLASGLFGHVAPVHAGDVSNAQLTCFVDTYAFDYPRAGSCSAGWTPGSASNPSVAVFEVSGLAPGSYSFAWTDLETGSNVCDNSSVCFIQIATETYGDGYAALALTVTDNASGTQNTVVADASYMDAWN